MSASATELQFTAADCLARMRTDRLATLNRYGLTDRDIDKSRLELTLSHEGSSDNHKRRLQDCSVGFQTTVGGYDPDFFVDELDSRYSCGVCLLGLRNSVQTNCGHHFCESSIQALS